MNVPMLISAKEEQTDVTKVSQQMYTICINVKIINGKIFRNISISLRFKEFFSLPDVRGI